MRAYFADLVTVRLLWIAVLTAAEHTQRIRKLEARLAAVEEYAIGAEAEAEAAYRLANAS